MAAFIIFTGRSDHDSVNGIAADLADALRALGQDVATVDLRQPDHAVRLRQLAARGEAVAISIAGMGMDMRTRDNIYAGPALRLASILLDHPLHHWDQAALAIPRRLITVIAPWDRLFLGHALPATACGFLPHGAPAMDATLPWARRDIDILLCAARPESSAKLRADWAAHGPVAQSRLERIGALMEGARPPHPAGAIETVLREDGVTTVPPHFLYPFFVTIDRYLRARERERVVTELHGLPLTLVGPGWESGLGPLPLHATRALMARSRLVLNPMPSYHGAHERLFSAMAAGAAAVTLDNDYVATLPVARVAGSWRETVLALRERDGATAELARAGCAAAAAAHTMRHRAEALLALLAGQEDGLMTPN